VAEGQRKKVLVVNDTQEILTLFNDILESEGHEVHLYSFAFDDLSVVKEVGPDLVVLDLIIGNEDHGWQLLQKMKMDRETATIPVIVCSAAIRLLRELEGRLGEERGHRAQAVRHRRPAPRRRCGVVPERLQPPPGHPAAERPLMSGIMANARS
jgi:CheY-like chemotaxis protein